MEKYMLLKRIILLSLMLINLLSDDSIKCGDVFLLKDGSKAKILLHKEAQKVAQWRAEEFLEKKLIYPTPSLYVPLENISIKEFSLIIEHFWCNTNEQLLESAYYNFYMRNKYVWKKFEPYKN